MAKPLENYVRTHRLRTGLSQRDLTFLLGARRGDKVSRYERRRRVPTLDSALALQAALDADSRELFRGRYRAIERVIAVRAAELAHVVQKRPATAWNRRKLASLRRIARRRERTQP